MVYSVAWSGARLYDPLMHLIFHVKFLAIFNFEANLMAVHAAGMFYTNLGLEPQTSHFLNFQRDG